MATAMATMTTSPYSGANSCRRCQQPGHSSADCPNTSFLVCLSCGKEIMLTRNCSCRRKLSSRRSRGRCKRKSKALLSLPPPVTQDQGDNRIFVSVRIGNHNTLGLVDTGAMSSFVSKEIAVRCQEAGYTVTEDGSTYTAYMADGTPSQLGKTLAGIAVVNDTMIRHNFQVMETLSCDVLLGIDILIRLGLKLSLRKQKLWPTRSCIDSVENEANYANIKL